MSTVMFFIHQESQRYENRCRSAMGIIQRAKDMWEVRRTSDIPLPHVLRGLRLDRQGAGRDLGVMAERKMEQILDAQIEEAKVIADPDARRKFVGQLRANQWEALRGVFPRLYGIADRKAHQLLAQPAAPENPTKAASRPKPKL